MNALIEHLRKAGRVKSKKKAKASKRNLALARAKRWPAKPLKHACDTPVTVSSPDRK